jgi:antitoxin YefM
MSLNKSYSQARANLASLLETVTRDREIVITERRGREDVAMVAASELSSLLETAHLLRSRKTFRCARSGPRRQRSKSDGRETQETLWT